MDERLAEIRLFVERWGGLGPLFCFGLGGPLAGLALLWLAVHWLSAPGWASVEGQVVQARVKADTRTVSSGSSRTGGSGTRQESYYRADIVFHYRVNGRDYTGYGIGDGEDWNYWSYGSAVAAVARYSGPIVTVYYDPSNPERSALDTNIFGIVPVIMGGLGAGLLVLGFWLRRGRRAEWATGG
jgi:hypothetical protein